MKKLYILGNGVMAQAIAHGVRRNGRAPVLVSRRPIESPFANECYGESYDIENKDILLAFKPHALPETAPRLSGKAAVCISVLARTLPDDIRCIPAALHAVCMPNIAAQNGASVTPFLTDAADDSAVRAILEDFGTAVRCATAAEFSAAGVLSGCAPAYLALIAEALSAAGVREGLKKETAAQLTAGVFGSFHTLLQNTAAVQIRENICSPGGTTVEGIYALEAGNVRAAVMNAVHASAQKQRG